MSATLGALLKVLEPTWTVRIYERLDAVAQESSNPWNNAGTGHAALCVLNYSPEQPAGSSVLPKAVKINEQFEVSREFWHHLLTTGALPQPASFISRTPHMTFVRGAENVAYLRRRVATLRRLAGVSARACRAGRRGGGGWPAGRRAPGRPPGRRPGPRPRTRGASSR